MNPSKRNLPSVPKSMIGDKDGLVMLEYIGKNPGFETFRSTKSGAARYEFGNLDGYRLGYVDPDDAKRLLTLRDRSDKLLFRRYVKNTPLPKPPVQAVTVANPVDPVIADVDDSLVTIDRSDGIDEKEASEAAQVLVQRKEEIELFAAKSATKSAIDLAIEHGLNIDAIEGSGKDGKVLKSDVEALVD